MMTHNDCSQHGCWLINLSKRLSIPRPKFLLGEAVRSHYTNDLGVYLGCDHGIVVGLVWSPPNYASGWWYRVLLHQIETSPHLRTPFLEELHEESLEPDL